MLLSPQSQVNLSVSLSASDAVAVKYAVSFQFTHCELWIDMTGGWLSVTTTDFDDVTGPPGPS
jgi:hypothetical protein